MFCWCISLVCLLFAVCWLLLSVGVLCRLSFVVVCCLCVVCFVCCVLWAVCLHPCALIAYVRVVVGWLILVVSVLDCRLMSMVLFGRCSDCGVLVCCSLFVLLFVCCRCGWFLFVVCMCCCLCVGYLLLVVCWWSHCLDLVCCLSYVVCCGIVAVCCELLVLVFVVRCVFVGCCWCVPRDVLSVVVACVAVCWLLTFD